jgi:peptidoglycan/LPS O-acetylase OafA/YrhL
MLTITSIETASGETRSRLINIEIEYLRAVAILLVVALHAHALFANSSHAVSVVFEFAGSWAGVDLFFCISGYVISGSFQPFFDSHRGDGRFWTAALAFWTRRIFRLLPSAWLWLFIGVACSWLFTPSDWFGPLSGSIKSAGLIMINAANFAMADGILSGNAVYWTLALEDQFYLAFPFFLFLVPDRLRTRVLLTLIALLVLPDRAMAAHPFLWYTRLDAIMWGCLIFQFSRSAAYWRAEPKLFRQPAVALAVNAALITLLIIVPIARNYHQPRFSSLRVESIVAYSSAVLVFLASFERGYVLPLSARLKAVLAWIGARSYGLYLIHIPLYGIIKESLAHATMSTAAYNASCAMLIAVFLPLLAELNFRYVETPLRRKGKRLAARVIATPHPARRLADRHWRQDATAAIARRQKSDQSQGR